jgi:hypothetical protein
MTLTLFRMNTYEKRGGRGYRSIEPYSESAVGLPDRAGAGSMRPIQREREEPGQAGLAHLIGCSLLRYLLGGALEEFVDQSLIGLGLFGGEAA